jgi:hypothetical protein
MKVFLVLVYMLAGNPQPMLIAQPKESMAACEKDLKRAAEEYPMRTFIQRERALFCVSLDHQKWAA